MDEKPNESESISVKEPRRVAEITVPPLQEMEVSSSGNGNSEALITMPKNVVRGWLLWRNRRFLWRSTLCGLILAACFAFWLRTSYTSTVRLMPPEKESMSTAPMAMMAAMSAGSGGGGSSGGGGGMGDVASVASDLLGTKSQGALVVEILHGRTVEDALINRFDLRKVYKVKYMADARIRLSNHSDIAEDKKSGVIVVKVTDHDPQRAAQMGQGYVEAMNDLLASVSTSSARRERIFIEGRLKTVKQALDTAEHQFSDFASKNTAIDIPEQSKAMMEAAAVLRGQLIAAQSEYEGLSQIYTDSNVRVRSARARIDELQKQMDKMGADNATLSSNGEIYPSIRKLPLLGVQWADLFRESKIEETVYELLIGQYELAKIQEAKEVPSVQAYDMADVPERSSGPPRLLIIALGGLLGFMMSAAWVVGTAAWQEIDPRTPHKEFAEFVGRETLGPVFESAARVRERVVKFLPSWSGNGHGLVEEAERSDEQDRK